MDFNASFRNPIIKIGRRSMLLAILASFVPSIYLAIRYGALPELTYILGGWALIASTQAPYYFVEPISYFPILGTAGTYMSFLTGDISGMRVPATIVVQDVMKVEPGTAKAELVNTLAIAGSVITSTGFSIGAVIFGSVVLAILPESITGAFDFVLPAVYGATFSNMASRSPIEAVFAFAFAVTLKYLTGFQAYIIIPVVMAVTIALRLYRFKKNENKNPN